MKIKKQVKNKEYEMSGVTAGGVGLLGFIGVLGFGISVGEGDILVGLLIMGICFGSGLFFAYTDKKVQGWKKEEEKE